MKAVFIGSDSKTAELATLAVHLRWPDIKLLMACTAAKGLEMVEKESPDIVLLAPDFHDMTLIHAIQELRGFTNIPTLVLGSRDDETGVVTALKTGADDYVRLPCDVTEIMVRMWALLRRANGFQSDDPFSRRMLSINPATYEVLLADKRLTLTSTEYRLLYLLFQNRGTVVAHQTLERALWGDQMDASGLVKKYVQRLRRKLEDDAREPSWIASVHGIGYRFIGPP